MVSAVAVDQVSSVALVIHGAEKPAAKDHLGQPDALCAPHILPLRAWVSEKIPPVSAAAAVVAPIVIATVAR